jgi:hypothetical protein
MNPFETYNKEPLPTPALPTTTNMEQSVQAFETMQYELPYTERAKAGFELGFNEGPIMAMINAANRKKAEDQDSPIVAPEELNKMFPELEVPFGEPTKLSVAQGIAQRNYERKVLQQKLAAGDFTAPLAFASIAAGSVLDPVNLALDAVVGFGVGKIAQTLNVARRVEALGKFGSSVVYNSVGNIPQEWMIANLNEEEQRAYSADEIVTNSVIGAGAFAGLGAMARLSMKGAKSIYDRYRSPNNPIVAEKAFVDIVENKRIAVDELAEKEVNYVPTKDQFPSMSKEEFFALKNQILDQESQVKGINDYYKNADIANNLKVFSVAPQRTEGGRLVTPNGKIFLGSGFYASRSKLSGSLKNNAYDMAQKNDAGTYEVEAAQFAYDPEKLNLYSLHTPLDAKFSGQMEKLIKKNFVGGDLMTVRDIMTSLNTAKTKSDFLESLSHFVDLETVNVKVFEDLRAEFKNFDGFKYIDDMTEEGDATSFYIFEPDKTLKSPEVTKADLDKVKDEIVRDFAVKEQSLNDLDKFFYFDKESDKYFLAEDMKVLQDLQTLKNTVDPNAKVKTSIKESVEAQNEADAILNEAFEKGSEEFMSPNSKKEFDELQELQKEMEETSELFKAAANCISKGF